MQYNDEQLPNEDSLRKLRRGYATNVSVLQNDADDIVNTAEQIEIANNIEWQTNELLLNNLVNRAQNRSTRDFICGLIPLNRSDRNEINSYYIEENFRRNPSLAGVLPANFGAGLREYVRAETELLDALVQLLYSETNATRRQNIFNIIRRRLDALDTLASFWTNTIFG